MPQLFSLDTIAKKRVEKKGKLLNIIHTPGFFFFFGWKFQQVQLHPLATMWLSHCRLRTEIIPLSLPFMYGVGVFYYYLWKLAVYGEAYERSWTWI